MRIERRIKPSTQNAVNNCIESFQAKQLQAAQCKAILRRKGAFDTAPSVPNKRVLIVGVHPLSSNYYLYHDLFGKGIPFHVSTFTFFLENYNTDKWKNNYDIIIFGGVYTPDEPITTTPSAVRNAVLAIINGGLYKLLQISTHGMLRNIDSSGNTYPSAYWFDSLGCMSDPNGAAIISTFPPDTPITNQVPDSIANDGLYKLSGICENVKGDNLICIMNVPSNTDHWIAMGEPDKRWAVIGSQGGLDNPYNTVIDHGKIIWWLRGIKSGICFNYINGKKYVGLGIDCDITSSQTAIERLRKIIKDKPLELGLVVSKLSPELAEYYQKLQSQGVKIVSHTFTHFDSSSPAKVPFYDEYDKGLEVLESYGFFHDGIIYMTLDYTDYRHWIGPISAGYLNCGYRSEYKGRCWSNVLFSEFNINKPTSFKTNMLCPIFGTTLRDDIQNMRDNSDNAYSIWVTFFDRADSSNNPNYGLPLILYFHDKPLTDGWNEQIPANNYYSTTNPDYMDRRQKYYEDIFSYINSKGYTVIRRSTAMELIYDITNCVSILSEAVESNKVTTKVVSSRRINGLTLRIPNDAAKTVLSITVEGIAVNSSNWSISSDRKWVFVGINVSAGLEHTVVVNFV